MVLATEWENDADPVPFVSKRGERCHFIDDEQSDSFSLISLKVKIPASMTRLPFLMLRDDVIKAMSAR